MTRIVALGICLAILFSAGCGGNNADGTVEIVVWEQKDPEEQLLMRRQLDRYMADHPGVTVSTVHFETDQLHSQFQTAALAGGGPDLVYGPSDKIGPYSVMGLIRPLDNEFAPGFLDHFETGSVPVLGGSRWAVPDQIGNHLMLIYNRAFVSREPADSDELIAMCRTLTVDEDGNGIPEHYGLVFNSVEPFWLVPFLGGYGGSLMDEENRPTLDTPAMRQALEFLADLRNRYGVIPKESSYELSDTMFKKGQAAFVINGPWSLKAYLKAGMEIGVMALPPITATGLYPAPMVSSKGYSISVNVADEKLPAVEDLLVFLTSEEVQREIVGELLILPSRTALFEDEALTADPLLKGSLAQALHGRPMPVVPEMRAVWDAVRPFYQSVLGGQMKADEAARAMQERAEKKIAEMKR
ncbi:MAG: extracellular solute-binding protein [Candidatus Krumholzibacteriota bacterium]|nr:extracellular solute-binding protein [Candidatus Krumholzibacteriota bacterium]